MKNLAKTLLLFLILISFTSCAASSDETAAQKILIDFFQHLHDGEYQQAADLYQGSYEWLQNNNPEISPGDRAALLEMGCRQNGLTCLEVRSAVVVQEPSQNGYLFQVEFKLDDGSLFVLGPCCGATEEEMPPVSQFQYRVLKGEEGSWGVANLPPYVP